MTTNGNNIPRNKTTVTQCSIDYMMNMTKEFLSGKINEVAYTLDFPYELEKRTI